MSDSYVTTKIHKDINAEAKRKKISVNQLYFHQRTLLENGKTAEQNNIFERIEKNEGMVFSLVEVIKSQNNKIELQTNELKELKELIIQQNEISNKLLNAFAGKMEFIEALEKEITK